MPRLRLFASQSTLWKSGSVAQEGAKSISKVKQQSYGLLWILFPCDSATCGRTRGLVLWQLDHTSSTLSLTNRLSLERPEWLVGSEWAAVGNFLRREFALIAARRRHLLDSGLAREGVFVVWCAVFFIQRVSKCNARGCDGSSRRASKGCAWIFYCFFCGKKLKKQ